MTIGKDFLAAVVVKGSIADLLQGGQIEHLFRGNEIDPFKFVMEFVKTYGAVPTLDTILAHTGEELPDAQEPPAYYRDLMEIRYVEATLKTAMKAASDALQPNGLGADKALSDLSGAVLALLRGRYGSQLADLRQAHDLLMATLIKQMTGGLDGLMLGWPYLDEMTGGLHKSDLVSFVGRPGMGKTWQLLYGAHHGWLKAEKDPQSKGSSRLFVSMEMPILQIEQRLVSMHLSMPFDQVKKGSLSNIGKKKYKKGLVELQGYKAPFWVVDGNLTTTVADVLSLAQELKPDAIFIDGAYLLAHPKAKDRYTKVAENLDLLKKDLAHVAPTVCSWQFNREATKKKKGEDADLADIGYTDAIGHHSSLVLGLFEDDTVETLKQRRVKVLKGRSGETGQFLTKWKFDKMDFAQVEETSLEDHQVV